MGLHNSILCYRYGHVELMKYLIDTDLDYEEGDLLYWDSGTSKVKPAGQFTWSTNLSTTQRNFADVFVGVCREAHDSTKPGAAYHTAVDVDVSSVSVYEYPIDSTTTTQIEMFGITNGGSGTTVMDGSMAKVTSTDPENAIARLAKYVSGTVTKAYVTFAPTKTTSSSNTNAQVGGVSA